MKLRNRWLIVVLICGVQLIATLWLVSYQLDLFGRRSIGFLGQQVNSDSGEIAQHILHRELEALSTASPDEAIQILKNNLNSTPNFDQRTFFVIDSNAGTLVSLLHDQSLAKSTAKSLNKLLLENLDTGERTFLIKSLQDPNTNQLSGRTRIAEADLLVALHRLPQPHLWIVIGQPTHQVFAGFLDWLHVTGKVCFSGVLLLGFVTLVLTTSVLQKLENRLSRFHTQLQDIVETRTYELGKTKNGVIFGLAKLAESRDNDTGEHLDRIRSYVMHLAKDLRSTFKDIDEQFIQNLSLASSLHDIGKVGIPDAVLLKPGRLTDIERKIMQFHTTIGHECLEAIEGRIGSDEFLRMACDIARFHHERWDGKGYPDGVAGNKIPLAARIVSVADVYDALTSRRPYKEPMSHEKSCEIIFAGSGTQFDPEVVKAFERCQEQIHKVMKACNSQTDDADLIPAIAKLQQALAESPSANEAFV